MSKTIKLEDAVHQALEELRGKRETFSQAVARLVNFHREITRAGWSSVGEHPRTPVQRVGGDDPWNTQSIIQEVCQAHGVSPEILKDGRRTRARSLLRKDIAERLRKEAGLSWVEIGKLLGRSKSYREPKTKA